MLQRERGGVLGPRAPQTGQSNSRRQHCAANCQEQRRELFLQVRAAEQEFKLPNQVSCEAGAEDASASRPTRSQQFCLGVLPRLTAASNGLAARRRR